MKTQIITLKITVDNMDHNGNYSMPDTWDWLDLLDLSPNESVEVLHSEEVKNG